MPRQLYALLVGIDSYPQPVPALAGAVNDVRAFESYLSARVSPDFKINRRVLLDQQATRAAVIEGFERHLSRAGPSDVALFVFSGHGSQQLSPEEFWDIEPDHRDETLVCWDSRLNGSWDLADKEIANLIAHISRSGAHTVMILDCCHSGSGTRATGIRQIRIDQRERLLSTFWGGPALALNLARDLAPSKETPSASGWRFPKGEHILLAACASNEVAREVTFDRMQRGVFSYYLLQLLANTNVPLTYRTLFRAAAARVRAEIGSQTPQIEPTSPALLDLEFLTGAAAGGSRWFLVHYDSKRGWLVDAGAIHGIHPPTAGETALALFPYDTPDVILQSSAAPSASAIVKEVFLDASAVTITTAGMTTPEPTAMFKAVVTATPSTRAGVAVHGPGAALIRERIRTGGPNHGPSLYVTEVPVPQASISVVSDDSRFTVCVPAFPTNPPELFEGISETTARKVFSCLEAIAHWLALRDLSNEHAQLSLQDIEITIETEGRKIDSHDCTFVYSGPNADPPTFTVRVTNRSPQPLYCAAVGLSEAFAVENLVEGGGAWLQRGETVTLASGPLSAVVPDDLWLNGVTRRRDLLKLIVARAEFDATRLLSPLPSSDARLAAESLSSLDQLLARQSWRELKPAKTGSKYTDWRSFDLQITVVRPATTCSLHAGATAPTALAGGFLIEPHPSLDADVTPTSSADTVREASSLTFPSIVLAGTEPLISGDRALGLDVLEFTSVRNPESVTEDSPLRITVPTLENPADLLVFGWDGEFFLPVGHAHKQGSAAMVELYHLPAPTADGKRSLTGSIRLYFRKVLACAARREFQGGVLAAHIPQPDGSLDRVTAEPEITKLVNFASDITILIHGIIGDTSSMVENARFCGFNGLLLTFDYENLNTTIEDTARQLSQTLRCVGLRPDNGKRVRIVAHSMGGLVSRWLIEREQGAQIISELVMAGTPNGGSPWPAVEHWATFAVGAALNGLIKMVWPLPAFSSLVHAANGQIAVTLRQMDPASDFLENLNTSPDTGSPYTLLAGNTAFLRDTTLEGQSRLNRLLAAISPRSAAHGLLGLFFFSRPNDIAVSVESMKSVGTRPLSVIDVPCDHLTYFSADLGQQVWHQLFNPAAEHA